ncbi:MAG TPA: tripartite tricarboxylate transporter TctB family protein [Casimicrobiaceae bacterium]|nr:tripartite tricarboxylate transporter TctB family protein [Casimicrobiaceae bacterium]
MKIGAPKDFWSGLMFIAFAAVAMLAAGGYSLGSVGKMGPGYFPLMLGYVLALIGVILVARSFVIDGERMGKLSIAPLAIVALAVCLFAFSIETLGLVIALATVTVVSALASKEFRPIETGLLAAALAAFAAGIFVYGLRLPLPIWPAL